MGNMRTELSFAPLAAIATELLAVLAADTQTEKGPDATPKPTLLTADAAFSRLRPTCWQPASTKAGANETVLMHGRRDWLRNDC